MMTAVTAGARAFVIVQCAPVGAETEMTMSDKDPMSYLAWLENLERRYDSYPARLRTSAQRTAAYDAYLADFVPPAPVSVDVLDVLKDVLAFLNNDNAKQDNVFLHEGLRDKVNAVIDKMEGRK